MGKRSPFQGIPRSGKVDPQTDAIINNLSLLTGQTGKGLYRALNLNDLKGLQSTTKNEVEPIAGVQDPTKPTNLKANSMVGVVLLSWDTPSYKGHSFTEVYRSDTNSFGDAVKIGDSASTLYPDEVGDFVDHYYWVRHTNLNEVQGPLSDSAVGAASQSAEDKLNEVADAILTDYTRLGDHLWIDEIIQSGKSVDSLLNLVRVEGVVDQQGQQIVVIDNRVETVEQSTIRIDGLVSDSGTGIVAINALLINHGESIAATTITANTAHTKAVNLENTVIPDLLASRITYVSSQVGHCLIDGQISSHTNQGACELAGGAWVQLPLTQALDSAMVQVTYADNTTDTASVNQWTQAVANGVKDLTAQWGVQVSVNDLKGGIGLVTDGNEVTFNIEANKLNLLSPNPLDDTVTPLFAVDVNGSYFFNPVWIDTAHIDTLISQTVNANYINTLELNAVNITGGSIDIGAGDFTVDSNGSVVARDIALYGAVIYDTLGNVLLSSGTKLSTSNITGLGALATQSSVNYSTQIYNQPTIPTATSQLWDNIGLGTTANWANVTGTGKPDDYATNNKIYRQTNTPSGASFGDLWFDTDDNILYRHNGSGWDVVANNATLTSQLTDNAGLGQTAVWTSIFGTGKPDDNATNNQIYRQTGAPTGASLGDLWFDTDDNIFYRHNGSNWDIVANHATSLTQITDAGAVASLDQITSTYIANLAVDTLKIAGNAVTVASSFTIGTVSISANGSGSQQSSSMTVSSNGVNATVIGHMVVSCRRTSSGSGGDKVTVTGYLYNSSGSQLASNTVSVGIPGDVNSNHFIPFMLKGASTTGVYMRFNASSGGESWQISAWGAVHGAKR